MYLALYSYVYICVYTFMYCLYIAYVCMCTLYMCAWPYHPPPCSHPLLYFSPVVHNLCIGNPSGL